MLDKKDLSYILKRVIIYILIAVLMFLFNVFSVNALTFSNSATYNKTVQAYSGLQRGQFGLFSDDYFHGVSKYFSNPITVTCDTEYCGIELYYTGSVWFSADSTNYNITTDSDIISTGAQLLMTYQMCSVENGTISCMVRNNTTLQGISLHFTVGYIHYTDTSHESGSVYYTLNDQMNIYNIDGNSSIVSSVNDVNNTLNDSSGVSDSDVSGSTSDWSNLNSESGVINQLVLMPITLLNSFVNGINGTCSTYTLGELWGESLTLPCIDLSSMLGSLWSIIDVILSGVFIFVFGKQCVKIFNDFTNLRSGQIDTLYGGDN